MGFLTVNGMLLTYEEYKELIEHYKVHGLLQFLKLYKIHEQRTIPPEALHWGEEIEYHLYSMDAKSRTAKLSCDANDIIQEFDHSLEQNQDYKLLPEYGEWMIEAVPNQPYQAYSDPAQLLSCHQ